MSTQRLSAMGLIELVADPGSWTSWDEPALAVAAADAYAADLAQARERSGLDEALVTGTTRIRGRTVAAVVGEFSFLAGSIGVAAAERLVRAVERATAERLPLVAAPVSGGTRMQEGTVAFLQMAKITQAVMAHRSAGLPYLVYLRHPTTGGVFASWGSLGHVTVAEPGALVGFLGPRVYEAMYGAPFPPGVQLAENLHAHGLIDAVVPPEALADIAARALDVLAVPDGDPVEVPDLPLDELSDAPAWEVITRSRRPDRPGVRALLRGGATSVTPLFGTGEGDGGLGLLLALARFGSARAVVLGQDRRAQTLEQPLGPASLRTARRGMRLAAELGLPLVTIIDTGGAALSREAEEGGLAGEIARSLADLITLPSPTLCLLLGQGGGGGALALLPADRVLAAENSWLSPLPPEGASAILYRTTDRAPEVAAAQGVRALDLRTNGIVDRIVAERPDAADEPEAFVARVVLALEHELAALMALDDGQRRAARQRRYRTLGRP